MTIKWNETCDGNVHVDDGCMGFWATFPEGTTAKQALDAYMSTADYSAATKPFTIRATIEATGETCSTRYEPDDGLGLDADDR